MLSELRCLLVCYRLIQMLGKNEVAAVFSLIPIHYLGAEVSEGDDAELTR